MKRLVALLSLILIIIVTSFLSAHAQPELKVGQEVKIFYELDSIESLSNSCSGIFKMVLKSEDGKTEYYVLEGKRASFCIVNVKDLKNYRILGKPAPRPEFKLQSMKDYEGCLELQNEGAISGTCPAPYKDHRAIADELRYLRKEIEALKK